MERDTHVMKKKIPIFVATALLAVALLAVFALRTFQARPGLTQEDFQRLQPGMTQADAERSLYGPPRNDLADTAIIWMPQASGQRVSARIEPDSPAVRLFVREDIPKGRRRGPSVTPAVDFFPQVTSKKGHQGVWVTSSGLIALYFGPDGRLQHKYHSEVDVQTTPSITNWLASRPRMIRQSLGF
jgi:hypothetical protein